MAEIIECPQCNNQLHLPDNMIGKRVKCPLCQNIFLAHAPGMDPNAANPFSVMPEPEPRPESREREPERSPEREPERPSREGRRRRYDEDEDEDDYDDRRSRRRDRDRNRDRNRDPFDLDDDDRSRGRPHRGGQILTMAILGLFCFGIILGPIAWSMASEDLGAMRRGSMDRSGEGATRAGMVIGIIATVGHIFVCGGNLLLLVASA